MFTVDNYRIVFKRRWHNRVTDINGKYISGNGRYDVICDIYVSDLKVPSIGNVPIYKGIARLHPNDMPDRIVGKKIALRNALKKGENADFWRQAAREVIWKAFWSWVESWSNKEKHENSAKTN